MHCSQTFRTGFVRYFLTESSDFFLSGLVLIYTYIPDLDRILVMNQTILECFSRAAKDFSTQLLPPYDWPDKMDCK
jgi:hypothetical protein